MFYGPNVLVAFVGAIGVLVIVLASMSVRQGALGPNVTASRSLVARLQTKITQAGFDLTVGEFLRTALLLGMGLGVALFVLTSAPASFALGALVGILGYWSYLEDRRERFRRNYQDRLIDLVDMLKTGAAASFSVRQSLQFAYERAPQILKADLAQITAALNTGANLRDAFRPVLDRRQDLLLDRIAEALLAIEESGGSLIEVLNPLAEMLRGLSAARRRIATAQTRVRWEARIVCLAPLAFVIILNQTAPDLEKPFYGSWIGQITLIAVGLMCLAAYYIMNRIGQRALQALDSLNAPGKANSASTAISASNPHSGAEVLDSVSTV